MTTKGRQKMELKAVVKKEEALKRTFKGVNLDSLAVGESGEKRGSVKAHI
jgi:hypothetical protein